MKLTTGTFEQLLNPENYTDELQKYKTITVILEDTLKSGIIVQEILSSKIKHCKLSYKTLNNTIINLKDYTYYSETSDIIFYIPKIDNLFFNPQNASGGHWSPSGDQFLHKFDALKNYLKTSNKTRLRNSKNNDIDNLSKSNIFDINDYPELYKVLTDPNQTISSFDWGKLHLGEGIHKITYSGTKEPPTFKASGWDYPMFWYEAPKTVSTHPNNPNGCVLILENINLEFDNFNDSAIRISHYLGDYSNNMPGPHSVNQRMFAALILNNIGSKEKPSYFKNCKGNSTIYISSAGTQISSSGVSSGVKPCYSLGYDIPHENSFINCNGQFGYPLVCPGGPPWAGILTINESFIDFCNNTIGTPTTPTYHGGAAIYVKNGSSCGNGAGLTYKSSTLNFDSNVVVLYRLDKRKFATQINKDIDITYHNAQYDYYVEGGGAIRSNNIVGGGTNILTFNNNSIRLSGFNSSNAVPDYNGQGGGDNIQINEKFNPDDLTDGAWGGAIFCNDGWWNGYDTVNMHNNSADIGSAVYMTNAQDGSFPMSKQQTVQHGKWTTNKIHNDSPWTNCDVYGDNSDPRLIKVGIEVNKGYNNNHCAGNVPSNK